MRICILYDCLFPYTLGGAERWYRNLAERLADEGHVVTYLTLRQWDEGGRGEAAGVDVVAVGPRLDLYGRDGARRIGPPLSFGLGVLRHLLRHGRSYDVVHTASFPFFSLLAAALLRPVFGYQVVVDWHEFWSRAYWREYLGPLKGRIGWAVQALCARVPQRAFCFARLTAGRLEAQGLNGSLQVLEGEYDGPLEGGPPRPAEPLIVFAGRHIPEKRAGAVIPAVMSARERIPDLTASLFGSGPETKALAAANDRIVQERGSTPIILYGHAPSDVVEDHLARALCMLLPSRREGYGMIVIEAAARGVPSVVVHGEDNAAVEHIEEGVNGFVAASASPQDLADAILRVHQAGRALRLSTADWFARNARRLSLSASLETVLAVYRDRGAAARPGAVRSLIADQRLRYAAVSLLCVLLQNTIVITAALFGVHYAPAICVSFVTLIFVGYAGHVFFTFRSHPSVRSLAAYAVACLINLPVAMAFMVLFCTLLHWPVAVGTPLTSAVMVVFNYLGARLSIPRVGPGFVGQA